MNDFRWFSGKTCVKLNHLCFHCFDNFQNIPSAAPYDGTTAQHLPPFHSLITSKSHTDSSSAR